MLIFLSTVDESILAFAIAKSEISLPLLFIISFFGLARIMRVQHYSLFYGMFNGFDGDHPFKTASLYCPRYIYELLAT